MDSLKPVEMVEEKKEKKIRTASMFRRLDTFNESRQKIENVYTFGREVGGGYSGSVYMATKKDGLGCEFAIKKINLDVFKEQQELLRNELKNLKEADHPNIVKLIEVFKDEKHLYLVMELCRGGDFLTHF